jgi:hypothetical protein
MMSSLPAHRRSPSAFRRVLLVAAVVGILASSALVLDRLFAGGLPAPFDFTAFWVAGRLADAGASPYDPALVHQTQRDLGMDDTAIVIWNPPWVLTLVMPVGALPFRTAYGAWVLTHLALMIASAGLLWRGFGGSPRRQWVAYLLTLTFIPTVFLIGGGQITAVVLFGLAGFLVAARANRPVLAGVFAALTAAKPHLLALFALWLLLEAARDRFGRRVVLGGLVVGLLACVPPTVANPQVWADYLTATTGPSSEDHHHLSRWTPPLAGWWLRTAVPGQPFWVQWVPLAVGVAAFLGWYETASRGRERVGHALSKPYASGEAPTGPTSPPPCGGEVADCKSAGEGANDRIRITKTPSPAAKLRSASTSPPHSGGEVKSGRPYCSSAGFGVAHHLPWLVGLSLLVAPYGVWQHDLVLLLVPIFAVAVKLAARPSPLAVAVGLGWFAAVNAAMLAMMLNHTSSEWYVWVVPTVLAACLLTARLADRPRHRVPIRVPALVGV